MASLFEANNVATKVGFIWTRMTINNGALTKAKFIDFWVREIGGQRALILEYFRPNLANAWDPISREQLVQAFTAAEESIAALGKAELWVSEVNQMAARFGSCYEMNGVEQKLANVWAGLTEQLGLPPTKEQLIDFWVDVGGGGRATLEEVGAHLPDDLTLEQLQQTVMASEAQFLAARYNPQSVVYQICWMERVCRLTTDELHAQLLHR